jgi:hypothetical protein
MQMSKTIQLRNVPDKLHRKLKVRARLERMSLSDYLIRDLLKIAGRPSHSELRERLGARARIVSRVKPATAERAERELSHPQH